MQFGINGVVNGVVLRCEKYVKAQHNIDGKLRKQRIIFKCNRTNAYYRGDRSLRMIRLRATKRCRVNGVVKFNVLHSPIRRCTYFLFQN